MDKKNVDPERIKLTSNLHLSNMVLFTENDLIQKFPTIESIIGNFSKRYELYETRKSVQLKIFQKIFPF